MAWRRVLFLLTIASVWCEQATAAKAEWLSGPELQRQLRQPVSVTWQRAPLREALERLSRTQKLAVLMDRRVDPGQTLDLELVSVPVDEALLRIAAREQIGVCQLGPVTYFGPVSTAARLRTVVAQRKEEVAALPPATRSKLLRSRAWQWDDLTTPRGLIAQLAAEAGVEIDAQQLPHDLWAEADLPALPWTDRLSLVLAQYDQTFKIDPSGRVQLVPMPERPVLQRSYALSHATMGLATELKSKFPTAQTAVRDGKLVINAPIEDLEMIAQAMAGKTARRVTVEEGTLRHTLKVRAPLDLILKKLEQLDLQFKLDSAAMEKAGIRADTPVTVDVTEATEDELLQAVLKPAGLSYRREGRTVHIGPATED